MMSRVVIIMMPILTIAREMALAATADDADTGKTDSDPEASHCPAVFTLLRDRKHWAFKYSYPG